MKRNRRILIFTGLLILMVLVGLGSGAVRLSPQDFMGLFTEDELTKSGRILLYVRLPRVAGAIVAGVGLSVAGAVIQTILNNPLAGPNIIGVNAGAGFAVVLCGVLLPKSYGIFPLAAFVGAFGTVVFVYYLGKKTGSSKITLVLAGVAINSLLNSASDAVNAFSESSLIASNAFKIGGLSGINTSVLKYAAIAVAIAAILVFLLHNELEVLSLGEDKAKTLGLPVGFYRFVFLMLAAVLAGASVSFVGLLGFVGLIVPHIARLLVGEECKYYILASAILGALFLLTCDYIARTWFSPYELPTGIILSFIGAPFFLWLLVRRKRGTRNA
ncbi:iron complex transport system permease protein [Kineothrix alysoides]|uniref:Iron complex transport system permease protein n=1 Tax=Kineothrix alysoides TaxID=1469948 RepID=A0A4R1QU39_9FIRM|nr:iron ABC transporter permease [Kineothrix alysoides]TCL57479.1 iron complex transport system permease protein [Kineothrix alysoides]